MAVRSSRFQPRVISGNGGVNRELGVPKLRGSLSCSRLADTDCLNSAHPEERKSGGAK